MTNCGKQPFADVDRTPRAHLGLLLADAAYRIAYRVGIRANTAGRTIRDVFREFPWLATYAGQIEPYLPAQLDWQASLQWLEQAIDAWEKEDNTHQPLKALRAALGMPSYQLAAVVMAGAVEEDSRFGSLYEALGAGSHRPSLGLLAELNGFSDGWELCRPMVECGFLEIQNEQAPRPEWQARVPGAVWNAARGDRNISPLPGVTWRSYESLTALQDIILPQTELDTLSRVVRLLASGQTRLVVIRGLPGCDRIEAAGAIAHGLGRGLMIFENASPLAAPLATLSHSMPVFQVELGAGETFDFPGLGGYAGPAVLIMGLEGGVGGEARHAVSLQLQPDASAERYRHWVRALNGHAAQNLEGIAERFSLAGAYIRHSARMAISWAALEGRKEITGEDVRRANRAINRQALDPLAQRLEPAGDWSRLVTTPATQAELAALQCRCRYRERLATGLGEMPGGLNRGVRALFEGPSGTGKTLAARILAALLELDVYRVDLAAVINKYIGETEKNLGRILTRAEDLDIILLLDEGDSLMSRRTDVKNSNDRYANVETNYLLQRLETYTGIVIVTTNATHSIDHAFRRRIDTVVKFPLPGPMERWALWSLHLPPAHAVSGSELETIAVRYPLSGGQIRNAAIHAGLQAMARGVTVVEAPDIHAAIGVEYRKSGGLPPSNSTRVKLQNRWESMLGAIQ